MEIMTIHDAMRILCAIVFGSEPITIALASWLIVTVVKER